MVGRRAAGAVLVGVALAGCGTATGAPNSATAPRTSVPAPRIPETATAWQEPEDYRFTVDSSCGERNFIGVYRVTVRNGEVVRADHDDRFEERNVRLPPEELRWVPTLGDMLDEARGAAGDPEAGEIVVVTDPGDGHPTEVRVDHHADTIDDESCYDVTDYEAGG